MKISAKKFVASYYSEEDFSHTSKAMMTLKALRQEGVQIGSRVVPLVQAMMTLKALQEGNKANDDAVASGLSHETHKGNKECCNEDQWMGGSTN